MRITSSIFMFLLSHHRGSNALLAAAKRCAGRTAGMVGVGVDGAVDLSSESNQQPQSLEGQRLRKLRVAVIGAGSAGLATGKVMRDAGLEVEIFERAPALGGIWRYDQPENTNRVLYQSLVTNLPKEVMQFEALPFDADLPSFVRSEDMLDYLRSYAATFEIEHLVRFNRTVVNVEPVFTESDSETSPRSGAAGMAMQEGPGETPQPHCWKLSHKRTVRQEDGAVVEHEYSETKVAFYDFVVVANGHYEKPHFPKDLFEGLEEFPAARLMHSRDYDRPEAFKDRTVICVGSRASGTDLAREIADVAAEVVVVDRSLRRGDGVPRDGGGARGNIRRRRRLVRLTREGGAVLEDDESAGSGGGAGRPPRTVLDHVDAVILCTGYDYHFPFLESSGSDGRPLVTSDERRVHPLYLQLFHAVYPSLAFVGIPHSVVPNPLHEYQATLLAATFAPPPSAADEAGASSTEAASEVSATDAASVQAVQPLPPLRERLAWVEALYAQQGSVRNTHHLGDKQWDYCLDLLRRAGRGGVSQELLSVGSDVDGLDESTRSAGAQGGHLAGVAALRQRQRAYIRLSREVYDDAGAARPPFTGEPDTYRRRQYHVDRTKSSWSVEVGSS